MKTEERQSIFHRGRIYGESLGHLDMAKYNLDDSRDLFLKIREKFGNEKAESSVVTVLSCYRAAVEKLNHVMKEIEKEYCPTEEYRNERQAAIKRFDEADELLCMAMAYDDEGKPIHEIKEVAEK